MTENTTNMRAIETITVVEGYEAVRIFLETVRRRHDEMADELAFVLAGLSWADGTRWTRRCGKTGWRP